MAGPSPTSMPGVSVRFRLAKGGDSPTVVVEIYYGGRGVGEVRARYDDQADAFVVRSSSVEPAYQGKGIGTAVYMALRDHLRSAYGKRLSSDSNRSPEAERLWTRLGTKTGVTRQGGRYVADRVWRLLANICEELDYITAQLPKEVS